MNGARASPVIKYPFRAAATHPGSPSGMIRRMDDPVPVRRRDPAWRWYALAVAALALVLVLMLTGVFDQLAP